MKGKNKNAEIRMSENELNALLYSNHKRVEEAVKRSVALEELDPMNAMYIVGRLDGVADALIMQRRGA